MNVTSMQGDTLDELCYRHLGRTDILESALELNPGLAAIGPILPCGTTVELPEAADLAPVQTNIVQLWD